MKDRPLKNRTTEELKALLRAMEPFEYLSNDVHRHRISEIRYELNMRLNPIMRLFRAAVEADHVHTFEMIDCARPMVCACGAEKVQP